MSDWAELYHYRCQHCGHAFVTEVKYVRVCAQCDANGDEYITTLEDYESRRRWEASRDREDAED